MMLNFLFIKLIFERKSFFLSGPHARGHIFKLGKFSLSESGCFSLQVQLFSPGSIVKNKSAGLIKHLAIKTLKSDQT